MPNFFGILQFKIFGQVTLQKQMISLNQIEIELKEGMKAKNQLLVEVLRGLKTRIMNEQIARTKELTEEEIVVLVKSELKRRKEAAESYRLGNRTDLMEKELAEAVVLEKYLPPQMSEADMAKLADSLITENNFTAKDFGRAMAMVKSKAGQSADGAVLAKILKERLK